MKTGIFGPGEGWRPPANDAWFEDYERGRPGWPAGVVNLPGLEPVARVVELGAGSGKLTRLLATRFSAVVAVEPDPSMRAFLLRACPEAQVVAGSAEQIPLADGSVDAVFVAEAFHRFNAEPALAEVARILTPGGALVLTWNIPAGKSHPDVTLAERFLLERAPGSREQLGYDPVDLNPARFESGAWQRPFETSPFGPLHEVRLANPQRLDRDGLLAFYGSMGWVADIPEVQREAILNEMRSLLNADQYERLWETRLYWTRLG